MPSYSFPPQPRDFRGRRTFPGTTGNPFDIILHRYADLEKLPGILFTALLGLLALVPHPGNWIFSIVLLAFYLGDWALLALLPRFHRSYGPPKPPVLLLAIFRTLVALLPIPVTLPFQVAGTLLIILGFWIEPQRLTLTHQILRTPKWNSDRPLRILHLGDLHMERLTPREEKLNQWIKELHPDLILFSGDFLNLSYLHDPLAWEFARRLISEWQAPLGVFAVTGSPAVDLPEIMPQLLKDLPIRWLDDEFIQIEHCGTKFIVTGLTCTHKPFDDAPRLAHLVENHPSRFSILLHHSPDLAPEAALLGFDLQLSGHTHGGQVRLPLIGALFTGTLYGKVFESGRYQIGPMTLYITRGIGLEGAAAPRVRLFCPPEIILWEIHPQPTNNEQPDVQLRP